MNLRRSHLGEMRETHSTLEVVQSHDNFAVVPPARFQRATSRLGGERSMQLSYGSTGVNRKGCVGKGKAVKIDT